MQTKWHSFTRGSSLGRAACVLFLALFINGCAPVTTDVTRFHRLPAKGSGQTFAILPPRAAGQIETSTYSARIAGHLEKYGWRNVAPSAAEYAVAYEYGISGKRETHSAVPIFGQTGGGTAYHTATINSYGTAGAQSGTVSGTSYSPPTYGVVGAIPVSQTLHNRWLLLIARDRKGTDLFEIRCQSEGSVSEISRVLPAMIDSAFADFPGVSGRTKQYSRPVDQ